jgi:hypothetical protein
MDDFLYVAGLCALLFLFFAGLFWIGQDLHEAAAIRSRTPAELHEEKLPQHTRAVRSTGDTKK